MIRAREQIKQKNLLFFLYVYIRIYLLEDRYEYDAFGKPYKGELNEGMNLGYAGKPYDAVTGMYNYGYRDYKPEQARFTTVDPVRDGANWFAYVNNDPVNWIDLWGLSATEPKQIGIAFPANVLNAGNLRQIQDSVRAKSMYQPGAGGPFNIPNPKDGINTWCNMSTYNIVDATGFSQSAIYADKDKNNLKANQAAPILSQSVADGKIEEILPQTAQILANFGYTVVVARPTTTGSGHLSTVRPSDSAIVIGASPNLPPLYNPANGPTVSNVGLSVGIKSTYEAFTTLNGVHYYYDPNQFSN